MSITYVSAELRREVLTRAGNRCEYCLISGEDAALSLQIDHIIAEKHGGETTRENLAAACFECNPAKGSDVASVHWPSGEIVALFHPRRDEWNLHFRIVGSRIEGLTPVGTVTLRLLRLNARRRLLERKILIGLNRYPG